MRQVIKEAIQQIKDAGFSHIKVELEGDLGRDGERDCETCFGEGGYECDNCNGSGQVVDYDANRLELGLDEDDEVYKDCEYCFGDGRVECDDCSGEGTHSHYIDEEDCEQIMRDYVSRETLDRLVYGNFYEDGSVDSEFTFTVAIEDSEDIIEWINAFKHLAERASEDGHIDVTGAGMHITLLQSGDYDAQSSLNRAGMRNFESEVTKLLPALFFVASSGHQSRDLQYRYPRISGNDKYSAIYTHGDTCLEYRLFETCYDRPEAIWDFIQAIAQTLKFYTNPELKVKAIGKRFGFTDGDNLARFYNTPEQLRILNSTIKEVKPKDKSFKKLKEERGVRYTIKSLTNQEKIRLAQLRQDYREYVKRAEEVMRRPLTESEQQRVDWLMTEDGLSRDDAITHIRGRRSRIEDFQTFVENNTRSNRYEMMAVAV